MQLSWYDADIRGFQTYLFESGRIQPATINSIIAAIRSRYTELLISPDTKHELAMIFGNDQTAINACLDKMRKASDPNETKFSYAASTRHYSVLSPSQISQLLNTPNTNSLRGLRDTAVLATMAYMGLRESETSLLTVGHLHLTGRAGEMGIQVPHGAASTERFVPFYEGFPVQQILDAWLKRSGIHEGPIFRGFYRNERRMRETAITIQAIEDICRLYPIQDGEQSVHVKPSDLRVFYARMLYALDHGLDVIAHNLGVQIQTVVNYIGTPSNSTEQIPLFDVSKL